MATLIVGTFARLYTILAINSFLASLAESAATATRACLARFFTRLHESRRREAARTLARQRHLLSGEKMASKSRIDARPLKTAPESEHVDDPQPARTSIGKLLQRD